MVVAAVRADDLGLVVSTLRGARRVSALCHENPDADTVGAAVAVALMAARLGAATEVVSCDPIPPALDFLTAGIGVHRRPGLEPDVAVVCDAATLERVGRVAIEHRDWLARATLVNVDHHLTSSHFGNVNLVDPSASATCEVLLRVVDALEMDLDPPLATALLAGIVRDSHGFSDPATSPATLRAAARLVEAGAALADVQRRVLAELPVATLALWGRMLGTLTTAAEGRIVVALLTPDMLEATGTRQHDADGLAEFLARARGAELVALLRELGPTETRVSIRTLGSVDATRIVAGFGGGGHRRRAGGVVAAGPAAALEIVIAAAGAELRPTT
jgi:phosphoesterase RecJ-like protein